MAAILFTPPLWQPMSGGASTQPEARLYFYQTGTTTDQSVYTTSVLDVAHAQPVEADSNGVFPAIYLDSSAASEYKAVLKDPDDVTLYTIDPISALPLFTSTDAGAGTGPKVIADRDSASPAAADFTGAFIAKGRNDAAEEIEYSGLYSQIVDPADGTEDGRGLLYAYVAGTLTEIARFDSTGLDIKQGTLRLAGSDAFDAATRFYPGYVDAAASNEQVPTGWTVTESSGLYTITHNLGAATPASDYVLFVQHNADNIYPGVGTKNANTVTVEFYDDAGVTLTSQTAFDFLLIVRA